MGNIKIHFAGAETKAMSYLLKESGINYALGTVYNYIINQFEKEGEKTYDPSVIQYWKENFKGTILDSGIFTLIYGAGKREMTKETWLKWQDTYIDFIKQTGFNGYPVEVDAQKIIGSEETWKLRERFKELLPNHTPINVWHAQDGQKGLDRIIEFSDYMAFSVQELRKLANIDHKDQTIKMVNYIKNKKPNIKIHLLACTEISLLEKLNFVTSSDSTSWLQVNKFGQFKSIQNGKITTLKKDEILDNLHLYEEQAIRIYQQLNGEDKTPSTKNLEWQCSYLLALQELLKIYSKYAGPQN